LGRTKMPTMIWNRGKNLIKLQSIAVLITMLVAVLMFRGAFAAKRSPTFERRLQRKVSVTWQGQQLAVALERLAGAGPIRLWLDRRVDRQQTVTMQCVDLPLVQALAKITQQQSLGLTQLENLVYIGPQQTALALSTLIRQARDPLAKTPTTIRKRWLRTEATTWPRLSEPRTLAESWLSDAGLQLIGSAQIAHDLWPEQSLPPLALVDRLVLLLAGFDLTCKIASDGKSCEVVPISRPLTTHPSPHPSQQTRQRPLPPAPQRHLSQELSHQRFTLRLENQQLGRVLDQFAQQLQLEVVWALEHKKSVREQLVSCDLQHVELDELLQSVLTQAGLQHQRQGKRVTIEVQP